MVKAWFYTKGGRIESLEQLLDLKTLKQLLDLYTT